MHIRTSGCNTAKRYKPHSCQGRRGHKKKKTVSTQSLISSANRTCLLTYRLRPQSPLHRQCYHPLGLSDLTLTPLLLPDKTTIHRTNFISDHGPTRKSQASHQSDAGRQTMYTPTSCNTINHCLQPTTKVIFLFYLYCDRSCLTITHRCTYQICRMKAYTVIMLLR